MSETGDGTDYSLEDLVHAPPAQETEMTWAEAFAPFIVRPEQMKQLMQAPAQFAPLAHDALLRRAQEEDLLDNEIWELAVVEALSSRRMHAIEGRPRQAIIDDFLQRHPPMLRFVTHHRTAGSCGKAVAAIIGERARRAARQPALSGPTQETVDAWMLSYCEAAQRDGRPKPKGRDDAFPACRAAIGASDRQMRAAFKNVPRPLKRSRGETTRQKA